MECFIPASLFGARVKRRRLVCQRNSGGLFARRASLNVYCRNRSHAPHEEAKQTAHLRRARLTHRQSHESTQLESRQAGGKGEPQGRLRSPRGKHELSTRCRLYARRLGAYVSHGAKQRRNRTQVYGVLKHTDDVRTKILY